jgi:hypothetical protein
MELYCGICGKECQLRKITEVERDIITYSVNTYETECCGTNHIYYDVGLQNPVFFRDLPDLYWEQYG